MTSTSSSRRSVPVAHFEEMFRGQTDPFDLASRWYERRKRSLTMAALGREKYETGLELGCAEGALTMPLAERVRKLTAVDGSETAINRASEALTNLPNVTTAVASLPSQFPAGEYDLIVFSELGYFMDADDLTELIRRASAATVPSGEFVAVHWRHPSADYPSDGDAVHEALKALMSEHDHRVAHVEADFLLDCWTTR